MFIPEARIEVGAARLWQTFGLTPGFDVEHLLDELGLGLVWEAVADDDGGRILGQLVPEERVVVLNQRHLSLLEERDGRLGRFTVGHEIGHWELHAETIRSGTLPLLDGRRTWCRDGSRQPAERQAEMFAAALLMPRDHLLAAMPKQPWRGWPAVYRLAEDFLVNVTPMKIRLETLGWMHMNDDGLPVSGPKTAPGQASLFDS